MRRSLMASTNDLVSWEVAMAGDVVEKDFEGVKEEAEDVKAEGLDCRREEGAALMLL